MTKAPQRSRLSPAVKDLRKSAAVAVLLSLVFPGLGHYYLRRWIAGTVFLAAAAVLVGRLGSAVPLLEEIAAGRPPEHVGELLFYTLALLAVLLACVWDAYRSARRP